MSESEKFSSASEETDKESLAQSDQEALDDIEEEPDGNDPEIVATAGLRPLGTAKNNRPWRLN